MIEKIISRLENRKNFCERDWENYHIEHDFGAMLAYQTAIDIVQEVAKEYGKDTNVRSNGWIPCSERLPKKFEKVQVTFLGFNDNVPYSNGNTAFINEKGYWCWTSGSSTVNVQIIAWRENLAPYQPKSTSRCVTCANYDGEEIVDNICYLCWKGFEDNYKAREGE